MMKQLFPARKWTTIVAATILVVGSCIAISILKARKYGTESDIGFIVAGLTLFYSLSVLAEQNYNRYEISPDVFYFRALKGHLLPATRKYDWKNVYIHSVSSFGLTLSLAGTKHYIRTTFPNYELLLESIEFKATQTTPDPQPEMLNSPLAETLGKDRIFAIKNRILRGGSSILLIKELINEYKIKFIDAKELIEELQNQNASFEKKWLSSEDMITV